MEKNSKQLPPICTIYIQQIGKTEKSSKILERTKFSFFDSRQANIYKTWLNRQIADANVNYRYIVVLEETTVYKSAEELIKNTNEHSVD
ncbi:MAG: hypothetical protein IJW36_00065 [Clostridia bacterium]|nr:hypothetical protein [Clostridia bacterium]